MAETPALTAGKPNTPVPIMGRAPDDGVNSTNVFRRSTSVLGS